MANDLEDLKAEFVHRLTKGWANRALSDDAFMEFLRAEYNDDAIEEIMGNEMCLSMLHQFWRGGLAHARKLS